MATLGNPPLRIDVMTSITGVTFADAWRTRLAGKMGTNAVFFLGRDALIKNKLASGRPKDLADVAILAELDAPSAKRSRRPRPAPSEKGAQRRGPAKKR